MPGSDGNEPGAVPGSRGDENDGPSASPHASEPGQPAHASLPGYDDLVRGLSHALEGPRFLHAMRELYWEDLRHWRYKMCLHYFRLSAARQQDAPSTADPVERSPAWEQVSQDLREYSAAKKRWQSFHEPQLSLLPFDPGDPTLLAARKFASEVYQSRCADQFQHLEAPHQALEAENEAIMTALQPKPEFPPVDRARRANERRAQLHRLEARHRYVSQELKHLEAFLSRFGMALFGGIALITPMLIMSLHDSKVTALATTSSFTFFVALFLAWFMNTAEAKDVMAATAAYAAVLVVFVGTVTQPVTSESPFNPNPANLSGGAIAGIVLAVIVTLLALIVLFVACCQDSLALARRSRIIDREGSLSSSSTSFSRS